MILNTSLPLRQSTKSRACSEDLYFELNQKDSWLDASAKAQTFLEQRANASDDPYDQSCLVISYALLGDREKLESTIGLVREMTAEPIHKFRNQAVCEAHIAICYLVLGDHDKAIETLEAANRMDSAIFLNRELDLWFIFDRLRGNPRFEALLKD